VLAVAIIDEGSNFARAVSRADPFARGGPRGHHRAALENSLTITIGSSRAPRRGLEGEALGGRHRVHVKVDTGMHRMGVAPTTSTSRRRLTSSAAIDLEGILHAFQRGDGSSAEDRAFTRDQIASFDEVLAALAKRGVEPRLVHTPTAPAPRLPEARRGMVRVGLALYGYLPEAWLAWRWKRTGERLVPALTLRANVVAVRRVSGRGAPELPARRQPRAPPRSPPSPRLRRRLSPPTVRRRRQSPHQRPALPLAGWSRWTCW